MARRILKIAAKALGTLSALILVLAAGAVLRLSYGPIDTPVPQSLLDRIMSEAAPGWRIEAGGGRLDFSSDAPLNGLQIEDVALFDSSGSKVASAPLLGVKFALAASLDPAKALTVREVAINGASVSVIRDEAGAFQFDIADASGPDSDASFDALMREGALDLLPKLRIEDANVTYSDLARDTVWRTEKARMTLDPSSEGLRGTLTLALEGGTGEAVLDAYRHAGTGETEASLTLDTMTPATIAGLHPVLSELVRIDAPLTGRIDALAEADGSIRTISAELSASNGQVRLHGDEPIELMNFSARLSCDAAERRCDLGDLAIATPDLFGAASGTVRQIGPGQFRTDLSLIAPHVRPASGGAPIGAGRVTVTGRFDAETGWAEIEQAALISLDMPLAEGRKLQADRARFSARIDTASLTVEIPAWRFEAAETVLSDGTAIRLDTAEGAARYADGRLDLTGVLATALAAEQGDTAHRVERLTATASLETGPGGFGLHLNASGVEGATPEGPVRAAELSLQAEGAALGGPLTVRSLRATGLTAPAATGVQHIASLDLSGVVDPQKRSFEKSKLSLRDATLVLPELYDAPVALSRADADFRVVMNGAETIVAVREMTATIDGLPAQAKGIVTLRGEDSAAGRLEATLGPVDLRRVPRHWPKPVAPGGLVWVKDNIKGGTVDLMRIAAQFDTADPSQDALRFAFDYRDALLTFAPGMPPIAGARGKGVATLDRLDLALDRGEVTARDGGRLVVDGSTFAIADFSPDIPDGQISLKVTGDLQPVLHLLDTEPLGVIAQSGLKIADTKGRADLRVLLDLPLAADLKIDDVRFDGRAEIHEYALSEPKTGAQISGDLLRVKATPDGMVLRSDARIDGLAARIGYRQDFEVAAGRPDAILSVESYLSAEDLARSGFDLQEHIDGLTALNARVALYGNGDAKFTADADLTGLTVAVDDIGWTKAGGVPATLSLSGLRKSSGAGRIDALVLRGEGIAAEGTIGFDSAGDVRAAQFSRILLNDALDIGLRYADAPEGATLRIDGPRLDLRHSFARAVEGSGKAAEPRDARAGRPTDITMDVSRVRLRDDLAVFDLRGKIRLRDGRLDRADLNGRLNGTAPAALRAESRADGIALRLNADDAGAFVRATDIFTGAYGGRLMLDARTVDTVSPSQIRGVIRFDDVVMQDAPTMRRILKGGGIAGLMRQLASGGIAFNKIQLPFSGTGSRWTIDQGVAYGPSLGLTLDGSYDLAARKLDLNGLVSPAYAINGALGNVPVLGKMLTGGEGEGVFGVTFSVEGDADHPSVRVNPLTALAPGFLRKIVAQVGAGGAGAASGTEGKPRFSSGRD